MARTRKLRSGVVTMPVIIEGRVAFLRADFHRGRWEADGVLIKARVRVTQMGG